jgi:acylphosphatase
MSVDRSGPASGGEAASASSGPRSGTTAAGAQVTAVRWEVVGRVQGVGFRWFVREQARRWGLSGWVRNQPDGSVEISARGREDALNGLLASVRRGPPGSIVEDVRIRPDPDGADFPEPFSILRG